MKIKEDIKFLFITTNLDQLTWSRQDAYNDMMSTEYLINLLEVGEKLTTAI